MEQNETNPKSLLSNLRSHHIVKVLNPLSRDFTWTVARSVTELDSNYVDQTVKQLGLRNDMHPSMKHVVQKVTLPQGQAMNLPGDVAQVIVKHLVDEIMNLRGHKATIGDAELRRGVEEEVIINTEDLRSQLSTLNVEEQLNKQIEDLNRESISQSNEVTNEQVETTSDQPSVFGEANPGNGSEEVIAPAGDSPTTAVSPSPATKPVASKK